MQNLYYWNKKQGETVENIIPHFFYLRAGILQAGSILISVAFL